MKQTLLSIKNRFLFRNNNIYIFLCGLIYLIFLVEENGHSRCLDALNGLRRIVKTDCGFSGSSELCIICVHLIYIHIYTLINIYIVISSLPS